MVGRDSLLPFSKEVNSDKIKSELLIQGHNDSSNYETQRSDTLQHTIDQSVFNSHTSSPHH